MRRRRNSNVRKNRARTGRDLRQHITGMEAHVRALKKILMSNEPEHRDYGNDLREAVRRSSDKPLSRIQEDVVVQMLIGWGREMIKERFELSENTVSAALRYVYDKMDVHSELEMAVKVMKAVYGIATGQDNDVSEGVQRGV